jgi:hypothetical protein
MPIHAQCSCGKSYQVKDELAGRKVRCAACQAVIVVPKPSREGDLDDRALQFLMTEDAPMPRRPSPPERQEAIQADLPRPAPKLPPASATTKPAKPQPPTERPSSRSPQRERRHRALVVSPGIITGVLMMVGAVVWFGLGLLADRIFFYPPVMFVLGLVATIKGLLGHPED